MGGQAQNGPMMAPRQQPNPWAASTSQGGIPGSTSSMYPNQQQFAPKPMMDPAQGVPPPPTMGQGMPRDPGMRMGFQPGGPGGFRGMATPVNSEAPQMDIASLLAQYRR